MFRCECQKNFQIFLKLQVKILENIFENSGVPGFQEKSIFFLEKKKSIDVSEIKVFNKMWSE